MKAKNYNVRKKNILAILSYSMHPYTAKEITDLCYTVSLTCISSRLLTYLKQGLVKRKRENKKTVYKYEITKKGLERLEYLLGSKKIKTQIEYLAREKIR